MSESIRRTTVEGFDLAVFDGFVPLADIQKVTSRLSHSPFTRSERASDLTADYRHFAYETPLETLNSLSMWSATKRALEIMRPGKTFKPYRAYINFASFGDMLFTHFDCQPSHVDYFTALWYLCDTWDVEWGGETMFFDAQGDAQAAVTPKPGRLCIFDGRIRHAGRPPNRVCYAPRYTFAIKLAPEG
jgi:Rps23 Pro-64 3,4-dihydroxylase Tpa1-like proline 4-hydroxylase